MYELGLNPYLDVLSEARYRELFGQAVKHPLRVLIMCKCIVS